MHTHSSSHLERVVFPLLDQWFEGSSVSYYLYLIKLLFTVNIQKRLLCPLHSDYLFSTRGTGEVFRGYVTNFSKYLGFEYVDLYVSKWPTCVKLY